jgi:hypothetical protein
MGVTKSEGLQVIGVRQQKPFLLDRADLNRLAYHEQQHLPSRAPYIR